MNIAVYGLGYVGAVTSACLAELGHNVIGVDVKQDKVDKINEGVDFLGEKGLEEILKRNVGERLRATSDLSDAVSNSEVGIICVGTPSNHEGFTDVSRVELVFDEIVKATKDKYVVSVRSTIPPRTIESLEARTGDKPVSVVANPEFLREGSAVEDFFSPGIVVIGTRDNSAGDRIEYMHKGIDAKVERTSPETAEMIKYLNNSWHSLKIAFTNEVSSVASSLGVDPEELFEVFCSDRKLNVSTKYHRPGFAYGGSCLPKDTSALQTMARRSGVEAPLIDSIEPSNQGHIGRAIREVLALDGQNIGVFGISFKYDGTSPDVRGSPVITLINRITELGFSKLFRKGFNMRVYDPIVNSEELGSYLPDLRKKLHRNMTDVVRQSDVLIVGNNHPDFRKIPGMMRDDQTLLDLQGVFNPEDIERGSYKGMYNK